VVSKRIKHIAAKLCLMRPNRLKGLHRESKTACGLASPVIAHHGDAVTQVVGHSEFLRRFVDC
jgi:hypothetical protein